ncbi:MAG: hypothetical protein SOY73_14875 [Blautia sp.]|nr:hypothetical protein [Blautia sp.]MDY4000347.1 hypothetical protein [Blautia sp.]
MENMEKRFFLNPVKHSEMIKYNLVYGLSADATKELLKQEKDTLVHYRGFLSGIFDDIPMAESEYTRKNGKGRKSNPIADHMVHYWNADTWKNQIYSLYLYGVTRSDPENEIIEAYCRNLQLPEWTAKKELDYREDSEAKEMLENLGILRKDDSKKKILVRKEFSASEDCLDRLKEMICFFNSFAPLSPLGFSILQRMSGNKIKIPFFVKGQSPFRTLRQENVYRCLLAITNHFFIECEDKHLVQPVNLEFADHFLHEKNCNVYVYVKDREGKYTRCPVPDNILLKLVKTKKKENDSNITVNCREWSSKNENEYGIYRITLLVNTITRDYLLEKACRIWTPELIETDDKDVLREIPYYPKDSLWKTMTLKYHVCFQEYEDNEINELPFDDMPNPGDTLRDSMSVQEYSELMEETDAYLPGLKDEFEEHVCSNEYNLAAEENNDMDYHDHTAEQENTWDFGISQEDTMDTSVGNHWDFEAESDSSTSVDAGDTSIDDGIDSAFDDD